MFIKNIYFSETDKGIYSGFGSIKEEEKKFYKKAYVGWKAKENIERRILKGMKKGEKIELRKQIGITKPEKIFDEITPDDVKYVGNKAWGIRTKKKKRYPDFKITGQNKVIEIFGIYWHDIFKVKHFGKPDDPNDRIQEYKEVGLECIVFWEYEILEINRFGGYPKPNLNRVLKRTLEFIKA